MQAIGLRASNLANDAQETRPRQIRLLADGSLHSKPSQTKSVIWGEGVSWSATDEPITAHTRGWLAKGLARRREFVPDVDEYDTWFFGCET